MFYCFHRPHLPPPPDWRGNLRRSRSLSIPNHRARPLTSYRHRSREYPPGWSSISHANSKVFPIPGLSRHTEPVPTRPNGPHPNPTKARHRIPIVQEKQPPVSDRPSASSPVCRKQSARKSGVASHWFPMDFLSSPTGGSSLRRSNRTNIPPILRPKRPEAIKLSFSYRCDLIC